MLAKGESSQAIDWYRRCSAAGEANCSYMAYRLYKVQNNEQEAIRFLEVASRQGHPVAIQKLSFYYISGRFGISGIVKGVVMYINNIPKLFKFARQNIAVDEPNLPL
jgi:TPR repeat protein